MNVSFVCRDCDQRVRVEVADRPEQLDCSECGRAYPVSGRIAESGKLDHCLICGCRELFVRKDFSQRLGVTIVVLGFIASSIAWGLHRQYTTYAILFATALVDVVLYCTVGNMLQCYRCRAEYRGLAELDDHESFNLETHERYRQQAVRLAEEQPSRPAKARQS